MKLPLCRNGRQALCYWQLNRLLPPLLFFTLAQFLFFGLPLILHARQSRLEENSANLQVLYSALLYPVYLLLCLYLVHRLFGFLHEQNAANLHFSWPLKRSSFFFSQNLLLALLLLIPCLGAFLQNLLAELLSGNFSAELSVGETACRLLAVEGRFYLALLAFSFFLELFYLLSGNSLNAILLAGLCNAAWPILIVAGLYLIQGMLPGFVSPLPFRDGLLNGFHGGLPLSISLFSPALSLFTLWQSRLHPLFYWLFFSLLLLFLDLLAFRRRPAEAAESEIGRSRLYLPVRTLAAGCFGLLLGFLFSAIRGGATDNKGTLPALIIGVLAGSLLAGLILDLLLSRGRLSLKRSLFVCLLAWLVLALPLAWLISGGFGFSTKVPRRELLTQVQLRSSDRKGGVLPSLRFTESDSLDIFAEKLKKNFDPQLAGMELPRDIFSAQRYQIANPDLNAGYSYQLNWRENGRSFWREIHLYFAGDPFLDKLWQRDPGLCLQDLLSRYGENYFWFNESTQAKLMVRKGTALSPEMEAARKNFSEALEKAPQQINGIFDALYHDYARRDEADRLRLAEQAPMSLRLYFDEWGTYRRQEEGENRVMDLPITEDCFNVLEQMRRLKPAAATASDPAGSSPR